MRAGMGPAVSRHRLRMRTLHLQQQILHLPWLAPEKHRSLAAGAQCFHGVMRARTRGSGLLPSECVGAVRALVVALRPHRTVVAIVHYRGDKNV